jgi:hypothetical protein
MQRRTQRGFTGQIKPGAFHIWIFALLLTLTTAAPLEAQFTYVTNNGSITITGYSGPGGAVTIPSNINNLAVTGIGNAVFKQNFNLTSVTLPNTLTSIGNNAFDSCLLLTQIVIPDSVTNIGNYAFEVCFNVTNVILGNGLLSVGDYSFYSENKLNTVVFGTNIASLGAHAFESTALTSIRIPDTVTTMAGAVFQNCTHLTNAVIGSGATSVPGNGFNGDSALTTVVFGPNVTAIGSQAFDGCGLTSVTIPDTITFIDISAFNSNPNLTSVVVGSSVATINQYAFAFCSRLAGIYFKGSAPALGSFAFSSDTATVYYLPWMSGWTSTYGGLLTAPWNPPVEPGHPAMQLNGFAFPLVGLSNQVVVVLASTNLATGSWLPISTNTLTGGPNSFRDNQSAGFPKRFYRLQTQSQ